jgi:hypothetical protein
MTGKEKKTLVAQTCRELNNATYQCFGLTMKMLNIVGPQKFNEVREYVLKNKWRLAPRNLTPYFLAILMRSKVNQKNLDKLALLKKSIGKMPFTSQEIANMAEEVAAEERL